jgi:hypothetical protein
MKLLAATTTLVLALATPTIAQTEETGLNRSSSNPCDNFSYLYTVDGQCIDLSYMTGIPEPLTIFRFRTALQSLGVPVHKRYCRDDPGEITFGYYQPQTNQMVLCTNNMENNSQEMIDTLVHESWHTVQDCLDGLGNEESISVIEWELFKGNDRIAKEIISSLSKLDFENIRDLYPEEQKLGEAEARYMEDHPNSVLEALNICSQS